jgi:hypothetical protein
MREVRKERTGWRDEELPIRHKELGIFSEWDEGFSAHHKTWGWNMPAIDLDLICAYCEDETFDQNGGLLMLEYYAGHAYALVDYKGETALPIHPKNLAAISEVATKAEIPFFVVFYTWDYSKYSVDCHVGNYPKNQIFTEKEYLAFMKGIRINSVQKRTKKVTP